MINPTSVYSDIETIRKRAPLVHNITNYVVMNTTANALLAIGASPVMAHAEPEVADMTAIAHALVLNIGTLSDPWIQAMTTAAAAARQRNIPIVLDPVGAGATPYRTRTARDLIRAACPAIIRGNASEIMALVDTTVSTKGVDSTGTADHALDAARVLSRDHDCTVCITGPVDYIIHGSREIQIRNGYSMMARVTGMGCTASALCGAVAAINPDATLAAAHALAIMGVAGEIAMMHSRGPGSFQMQFLDALFHICADDLLFRLRSTETQPETGA